MATISRRGHITDAEEAGGQSSHCHLGNSVKQSARLKYYTCGYNKDGACTRGPKFIKDSVRIQDKPHDDNTSDYYWTIMLICYAKEIKILITIIIFRIFNFFIFNCFTTMFQQLLINKAFKGIPLDIREY